MESFAVHVGLFPSETKQSVALLNNQRVALNARCSEGNDGIDQLACAEHEGNGASLAMTKYANMLESFQGAEVVDGSGSIIGEVGGGALSRVASGLSEASVVIAQGSDAVASEVIGNDCEGLVLEKGFVAVLQATARDEEKAEAYPRPLPKGGGQCEGAGEGVAPFRLPPIGGGNCYLYLVGFVGEGRLRRLWTLAYEGTRGERERELEPPLKECPHELSLLQFSFVGSHEQGEHHVYPLRGEFLHGAFNSCGILVGGVEGASGVIVEMEHQVKVYGIE